MVEPKPHIEHLSLRFCLAAGAMWGSLASAVWAPYVLIEAPLSTLIFSLVLGGFFGLVCSPAELALLRHKDSSIARRLLLAVVSPCICVVGLSASTLGFVVVLSVSVLLTVTILLRLFLPKVWKDKGLCTKCGYDLRGSLKIGRCPECGTTFDPLVHVSPPIQSQCAVGVARKPSEPSIVIMVLGMGVAFVIATWGLGRSFLDVRSVPYNQQVWIGASGPERSRMAEDLVQQGTLSGLSEVKVVATLGPFDLRFDKAVYPLEGEAVLVIEYEPSGFVQRASGSAFPPSLVEENFDTQRWHSGTRTDRLRMARDLFTHRSEILAGKSRDEVVDLLGRPGRESVTLCYNFFDIRDRPQRRLSGLGIDQRPSRLSITLKHGRVKKVRIMKDS